LKTWIFNASPLILLGKIERLDLLPTLFPSFEISNAVAAEVTAGPAGDPAKLWIGQSAMQPHLIPNPSVPPEIVAWDIGAGETAVISAALSRPGSVCVLDDLTARNCAEVYRLPVIGTLGVLLKAKEAGLLPTLRPEITRLVAVGSLLSD